MSALGRLTAALVGALSLAPPVLEPGPASPTHHAPRPGPAEIDTSGGVVTLVAPASRMILVPASTFTMGSTFEGVMEALAECQADTPGHRCAANRFSDETP